MSEFDDTDLSRRLRAAAGSDPDLAAARSMLGRRVARARRRRAALATGVATVSMLMMGTVYAWQATDDNGRITAANSSASTVDAEPAADATAPAPATTGSPATTTPASPSALPSPTPTPSTPPTRAPTDAITSPSGPTGSDHSDNSDNSDDSDGDRSFEETLPAGTNAVRTIVGTGGSITVRLATASGSASASAIRLTASSPIDGFVARTTTSRPAEVSVELASDTHRTRIRVRLDGSRLRVDVDETPRDPASGTGPEVTLPHGSTPGATAPGATAPGATAPGATAPDSSTPGATAPGATAPSSPGPNTTDDDSDSDDDSDDSGGSGSGSRDESAVAIDGSDDGD